MSHLSNHLTIADLDRVRRRLVSAEEAEAIGGHVRQCAECRALFDEQLAIVDSAAAFEAAFSLDEQERGELRSWPERRAVLWAGAAVAAVVAIFFVTQLLHVAKPPAVRSGSPVIVPHATVAPPVQAQRPEWDALITQTRASGVLPFPANIRALGAADAFRGEPHAAARSDLWPVATAIDDEHPTFRWPAVEGARYVVVLTSNGSVLARSDSLTMPQWRVPDALRRGQTIRWQVRVERGETTSILPAPPAPPAIFRVISSEEHEEIARAKRERPSDHLLLGLLYARAGIVDEARRELAASQDPLAVRLVAQLPRVP